MASRNIVVKKKQKTKKQGVWISFSSPNFHISHADVVGAVEFGGSFIGFAISFTCGSNDNLSQTWYGELGYPSFKTPTSILLTLETHSLEFSYDAAERCFTGLSGSDVLHL